MDAVLRSKRLAVNAVSRWWNWLGTPNGYAAAAGFSSSGSYARMQVAAWFAFLVGGKLSDSAAMFCLTLVPPFVLGPLAASVVTAKSARLVGSLSNLLLGTTSLLIGALAASCGLGVRDILLFTLAAGAIEAFQSVTGDYFMGTLTNRSHARATATRIKHTVFFAVRTGLLIALACLTWGIGESANVTSGGVARSLQAAAVRGTVLAAYLIDAMSFFTLAVASLVSPLKRSIIAADRENSSESPRTTWPKPFARWRGSFAFVSTQTGLSTLILLVFVVETLTYVGSLFLIREVWFVASPLFSKDTDYFAIMACGSLGVLVGIWITRATPGWLWFSLLSNAVLAFVMSLLNETRAWCLCFFVVGLPTGVCVWLFDFFLCGFQQDTARVSGVRKVFLGGIKPLLQWVIILWMDWLRLEPRLVWGGLPLTALVLFLVAFLAQRPQVNSLFHSLTTNEPPVVGRSTELSHACSDHCPGVGPVPPPIEALANLETSEPLFDHTQGTEP